MIKRWPILVLFLALLSASCQENTPVSEVVVPTAIREQVSQPEQASPSFSTIGGSALDVDPALAVSTVEVVESIVVQDSVAPVNEATSNELIVSLRNLSSIQNVNATPSSFFMFTDRALSQGTCVLDDSTREANLESLQRQISQLRSSNASTKMVAFSSLRTLEWMLEKHSQGIVDLSGLVLGFNMEAYVCTPNTKFTRVDHEMPCTLNEFGNYADTVICSVEMANDYGLPIVWGPVVRYALNASNSEVEAMLNAGLAGVAFQFQKPWTGGTPQSVEAYYLSTAQPAIHRYQTKATHPSFQVWIQLMASWCASPMGSQQPNPLGSGPDYWIGCKHAVNLVRTGGAGTDNYDPATAVNIVGIWASGSDESYDVASVNAFASYLYND